MVGIEHWQGWWIFPFLWLAMVFLVFFLAGRWLWWRRSPVGRGEEGRLSAS